MIWSKDVARNVTITEAPPQGPRPLSKIACDVYDKWPKVNYAAAPYLSAMTSLYDLDDKYGYDSAASIVRYFLSNANTWRGDDARRVKKELKAMLKSHSGY